MRETVETVFYQCFKLDTGLKPGVNEKLFVQGLSGKKHSAVAFICSVVGISSVAARRNSEC